MKMRRSVVAAAGGAMAAALVLGGVQGGRAGGETASAVSTSSNGSDVSRVDLDRLADRISADMHRWDGTFKMREVVVDRAGFVSVGVDDPVKAEPVVEKAFGKKHIKVEYVEQAQLF